MTISEFIEKLAAVNGHDCETLYLHPTLFIIHNSEEYLGRDSAWRERRFLEIFGIGNEALQSIRASSIVTLLLITPEERRNDYTYLDGPIGGQHWIKAFDPSQWSNDKKPLQSSSRSRRGGCRAIHFYGYKGGQGRSTVMLAFAKLLADSGLKVLAVDADLEAPSLDAMLGITSSDTRSTVMGLAEPNDPIVPIKNAYVGVSTIGQIDLLAARPAAVAYDLDFAAFLLNSSLDARVLQNAVNRLRIQIDDMSDHQYDVVLFDHRTGLAPSVLPIMEAWPGSAVIFIRPDGMARHIHDSRLLDSLLAFDSEAPGAFVSFSLDPKKNSALAREHYGRTVEKLLDKISDALTSDIKDSEDIDPAELEKYWIFWRHDESLVDGGSPSINDMSSDNRTALSQLRSVLDIPINVEAQKPRRLSISGASDEGQFILTPDLAKLFSKESPYIYILGRKGTGKTRLHTELCRQDLGEPLLVASDSQVGGLPSAGPLLQRILTACNRDFEKFWWLLIATALQTPSTKEENLEDALRAQLEADDFALNQSDYILTVERAVSDAGFVPRVFLIDGIETAVPAADLRLFVEALFRFLSAFQFNRLLSQTVTLRLFLRLDLANGSTQNIEQQIEGYSLQLHWKKTAILNFALARILSLPWFQENFEAACKEIEKYSVLIARGAVEDEKAEALLLLIFPVSLERNKLKTTTFFSTYFSDAGGDLDKNATFYPRLFDGFLKKIVSLSQDLIGAFPNERLLSKTVLEAYDQSSREFIGDVRTELGFFLNLKDDDTANRDAVERLVEAFNGQRTPFALDEMIDTLQLSTDLPKERIRTALRSMQDVGIFEDRPGYPGWLRTGRLYKAGLAMKYGRKREEL